MERFKELTIAFSLIILFVITTAVADELPLYFSMNGGFATTFDTYFEAGPSTGHLNYGPGWIGAVAVGARVSRNVRAEIEISNQVVFFNEEVINGFATIDLQEICAVLEPFKCSCVSNGCLLSSLVGESIASQY